MKQFSDFKIKVSEPGLTGEKIRISKILNKPITVHNYRVTDSKFSGKCLTLQIGSGNERNVVFTGSDILLETIQQIPQEDFPFQTIIVEENERYQFT